jgi:hypothetical protein
MLLVRYKSGNEPEIIQCGSEDELIKKIHELNLEDFHDSYFYERGKFENMGLTDTSKYDYYSIHTEDWFDIFMNKNNIDNIKESMSALFNARKHEEIVSNFCYNAFKLKFPKLSENNISYFYDGYNVISQNKVKIRYTCVQGTMKSIKSFEIEI